MQKGNLWQFSYSTKYVKCTTRGSWGSQLLLSSTKERKCPFCAMSMSFLHILVIFLDAYLNFFILRQVYIEYVPLLHAL